MKASRTKNLAEGKPTKQIASFYFPLLLGILFQQSYNMVDSMVVGRILGVSALAGVGSAASLSWLATGFCIGIAYGFVIPIAQTFGNHEYDRMKGYVINAVMLACIIALMLTVLMCSFCKPALIWSQTPDDIMDYAYDYLFVIFLGLPITLIYNFCIATIRSMGDSKTPVMYMVFCALLNILLDLLLISGLGMGVEGSSTALIIAQCITTLLCVRYLRRCDTLQTNRNDWHLDMGYVRELMRMALPTAMQYTLTSVGALVLQASINTLGSVVVASVAASTKVSQLFCCPFDALGTTIATYAGQNAGARKRGRIQLGCRLCCVAGIVYSIFACVIIFLFGDFFIRFFVDASEVEVIQNAHFWLKVNVAFFVPLAFVNILRFLIQGVGYPNQAIFAGVCEMIARTVVGVILIPCFGYLAVCIANPFAWVAACGFLIPMYFKDMKLLKNRFNKERQSMAMARQ